MKQKKFLVLAFLFIFLVNQLGSVYYIFPFHSFSLALAEEPSDKPPGELNVEGGSQGTDTELKAKHPSAVYQEALKALNSPESADYLNSYLDQLKLPTEIKAINQWIEDFKHLSNKNIHNPHPLDLFLLLPQQVFSEKRFSGIHDLPSLNATLYLEDLKFHLVEKGLVDGTTPNDYSEFVERFFGELSKGLPSPEGVTEYPSDSYIEEQRHPEGSTEERVVKDHQTVLGVTDEEGKKIVDLPKNYQFKGSIRDIEKVLEFPFQDSHQGSHKVDNNNKYDLLISYQDRVYHRISLPFKELLMFENFLVFTLHEKLENQNRIYFIDLKSFSDFLGEQRLPVFSMKLNEEVLDRGEIDLKLSRKENRILHVHVSSKDESVGLEKDYEISYQRLEQTSSIKKILFYYSVYVADPNLRSQLSSHIQRMENIVERLSRGILDGRESAQEILSVKETIEKLGEQIAPIDQEIKSLKDKLKAELKKNGEQHIKDGIRDQIRGLTERKKAILNSSGFETYGQIYKKVFETLQNYKLDSTSLTLLTREIDRLIQLLLNHVPKKKNATRYLITLMARITGSVLFIPRVVLSREYRTRHESKVFMNQSGLLKVKDFLLKNSPNVPRWVKRFLMLSLVGGGVAFVGYHTKLGQTLLNIGTHFSSYLGRFNQFYISDGFFEYTLYGVGLGVGSLYLAFLSWMVSIGIIKTISFARENKGKVGENKSWWTKIKDAITGYATQEEALYIREQIAELNQNEPTGEGAGQSSTESEKVNTFNYENHFLKALSNVFIGKIAHRNFFRLNTNIWQGFSFLRTLLLSLTHTRNLPLAFGYVKLPRRLKFPVVKLKIFTALSHLFFSRFFSTTLNLKMVERAQISFPTKFNGAYQTRFEALFKRLLAISGLSSGSYSDFKKQLENEGLLNRAIIGKESFLEDKLMAQAIEELIQFELSKGSSQNYHKNLSRLLELQKNFIFPDLSGLNSITSTTIANLDTRYRNFIYAFFEVLFFPIQKDLVWSYFKTLFEDMKLQFGGQLVGKVEGHLNKLGEILSEPDKKKWRRSTLRAKPIIVQLLREYFKSIRPLRDLISDIKSDAYKEVDEVKKEAIKSELLTLLDNAEGGGELRELLKAKLILIVDARLKGFNLNLRNELVQVIEGYSKDFKREVLVQQKLEQRIERDYQENRKKVQNIMNSGAFQRLRMNRLIIGMLEDLNLNAMVGRIRVVEKELNNTTAFNRITRLGVLNLWVSPVLSLGLATLFYPVITPEGGPPPIYKEMFGENSFLYLNSFIFGASMFFNFLLGALANTWLELQQFEHLASRSISNILRKNMNDDKGSWDFLHIRYLFWRYLFDKSPKNSVGFKFRHLSNIIYRNFIYNFPLLSFGQYLFMGRVDIDLLLLAYFTAPLVGSVLLKFETVQEDLFNKLDLEVLLKALAAESRENGDREEVMSRVKSRLADLSEGDVLRLKEILEKPDVIKKLESQKQNLKILYAVLFDPIISALFLTEELLAQLPYTYADGTTKDNFLMRKLFITIGVGDTNLKELLEGLRDFMSDQLEKIKEAISNSDLNAEAKPNYQGVDPSSEFLSAEGDTNLKERLEGLRDSMLGRLEQIKGMISNLDPSSETLSAVEVDTKVKELLEGFRGLMSDRLEQIKGMISNLDSSSESLSAAEVENLGKLLEEFKGLISDRLGQFEVAPNHQGLDPSSESLSVRVEGVSPNTEETPRVSQETDAIQRPVLGARNATEIGEEGPKEVSNIPNCRQFFKDAG